MQEREPAGRKAEVYSEGRSWWPPHEWRIVGCRRRAECIRPLGADLGMTGDPFDPGQLEAHHDELHELLLQAYHDRDRYRDVLLKEGTWWQRFLSFGLRRRR